MSDQYAHWSGALPTTKAAQYLGVSRQRLNALRKADTAPKHITLNRDAFFLKTDLDIWKHARDDRQAKATAKKRKQKADKLMKRSRELAARADRMKKAAEALMRA